MNPLVTRADARDLLLTLCSRVEKHRSAGGARIELGPWSASYSRQCQGMEGFCRMLWGIAPLLAGGDSYPEIERVREGLTTGADPSSPEFWGNPTDYDQRFVELAAVAFSLLVARDALWEPLPARSRRNLLDLLATINRAQVRNNNWRFFRVIVNVALRALDGPHDPSQLQSDLQWLDACYLGDGWYSDGRGGQCDYYVPWAMHFYGLLYAVHAADVDAERCARWRDRAGTFATDFMAWFSNDGSAVPYGRSMTYRFAQAAFWGGLAFARVETMPYGVVKGILLRHLRWWLQRPIWTETGLLSIGYGYENPLVAESYTSSSSPYWALKAFLPLALREGHPFWKATEQPLPEREGTFVQHQPRMILCRDGAHVFALAGGAAVPPQHRHSAEKYAKFCYSNQFGFSLPCAQRFLSSGAHDSMLALSSGGDYFRVRTTSDDVELVDGALVSTWQPWPDVQVTTWLVPVLPWHVRVHRIRAGRALVAAESGFAVPFDDERDHEDPANVATNDRQGFATVETNAGVSVVADLLSERTPDVIRAEPNTNVLFRKSLIPTLRSRHDIGEAWLACAVVASLDPARRPALIDSCPYVTRTHDGFVVREATGSHVFASGPATPAHDTPDVELLKA
jgi:hypothetical protein